MCSHSKSLPGVESPAHVLWRKLLALKKEDSMPGIENEMSMPYGDTCQALANLNFPIMREGHTEFEDTP